MTKYGFSIFFILFVGCVFFTKDIGQPLVISGWLDTLTVIREYGNDSLLIDRVVQHKNGTFAVIKTYKMEVKK